MEASDRLIAVIRSSSDKSAGKLNNGNSGVNPEMLLGPSGLSLLAESRENIYPLQRTFAGAIRHSLNNDVEPLCVYILNIIQETRKLKNEMFLRKLTHQLSSESDKRFQIYKDQIAFLKNVLKEHEIIYASPTKKKPNSKKIDKDTNVGITESDTSMTNAATQL